MLTSYLLSLLCHQASGVRRQLSMHETISSALSSAISDLKGDIESGDVRRSNNNDSDIA